VNLPLQLHYRPHATPAPTAWFLAGDFVTDWLQELMRCGLAEPETKLFVVPHSPRNRAPAGLLVVPARLDTIKNEPAGMACVLIAGRLFIPANAVLSPPVTDEEIQKLCLLSASFFHPTLGLSGFDEAATLRVWHLLAPPPQSPGNWNLARAGSPPLPSLQDIQIVRPPSWEELFGDAQSEIGVEPPVNLPPSPAEPRENPLAKSGRHLRRLFAKGFTDALGKLPHIGPRRNWLNHAEDWSRKQLQQVDQQLDHLRNKELHRLLDLFNSDPETALRHAIPMNNFAHRGVSPPSGKLADRTPHFDPGKLGGGSADYWRISWELQNELQRRYRTMANRETQLGRHRRAAYIYAQLLGDLASAANVLKQGRHFQEAAMLYEDHLQNRLAAARCFAEGGLLTEAIQRYEKLGMLPEMADLYERLGQMEPARKILRQLVQKERANGNLLGAAKLLNERLQATDEALGVLLNAWPNSGQAASCIEVAFQMLGKLGRHDFVLNRINQFSSAPVPPTLVLPLLTALSAPARSYPHEPVRHRAADFSRVLIARQLDRPQLRPDDRKALMDRLVRLTPQDRLLIRDTNRYLAQQQENAMRIRLAAPAPPAAVGKLAVIRQLELPRQIEWLQLTNEWHFFYALGVTSKHLTLVRGVWAGEIQSLSWKYPGPEIKHSAMLFEPTSEQGRLLAVARIGQAPMPLKRFPASDVFFRQDCLVGTPEWLPSVGLRFSFGQDVVWSIHLAENRAILSNHNKTGALQNTFDLTHELLDGADRNDYSRLCLTTLNQGAAIALGNRLVLLTAGGDLQKLELPGQAFELIPTLPHTRPGVAILLKSGAVMHWLGVSELIELDREFPAIKGAFVPGGPLVLISEDQILLLEVTARGVEKCTRKELTGPKIVGVTATNHPGEFAVLNMRGEISLYRLTS
jgi:tetratricopeptide (TPR) repeat protein